VIRCGWRILSVCAVLKVSPIEPRIYPMGQA